MKITNIILIILGVAFSLSCRQENIVELPLTKEKGYGPFEPGLRGLTTYSENSPMKKTYLTISGIPQNWTDVKLGDIETNIYQSVYQSYLGGNISKQTYESLKKAWGWVPDTISLSKEPIKCKIAFAFGTDKAGELRIIIDSNNNFDLSDDKIFKPIKINSNKWGNLDSLALTNSVTVEYERFIKNKIVEVNAPILIVYQNQSNRVMYNFPQYFTAKLKGRKIAICSSGFSDLSYHNSTMVLLHDNNEQREKENSQESFLKNEYIELKSQLYKNLGVNLSKNALMLEKTNSPKNQLYSSQVGFKSFPFEGIDFLTKSPISLNDFEGKYVLLDFWAIYCGPCINEMPNIKKFYENIDKSKFEIVGIVADSPPEAVKDIITENSITWPQILSNDTNKIKELYGIHRYPTTLLLNPDGVVIAKDSRGKELEDKIIRLINE